MIIGCSLSPSCVQLCVAAIKHVHTRSHAWGDGFSVGSPRPSPKKNAHRPAGAFFRHAFPLPFRCRRLHARGVDASHLAESSGGAHARPRGHTRARDWQPKKERGASAPAPLRLLLHSPGPRWARAAARRVARAAAIASAASFFEGGTKKGTRPWSRREKKKSEASFVSLSLPLLTSVFSLVLPPPATASHRLTPPRFPPAT